MLRLLRFTNGGHRVEESASAVKELKDRGVGSIPLVLQKGVEDGKVAGLNSGSDDQDLIEEWGDHLKVLSAKMVSINLISRDTGRYLPYKELT